MISAIGGLLRLRSRRSAWIGCEWTTLPAPAQEAPGRTGSVLVGAAEDLADALVLENGVDRLGEDLRDRQHLDLVDLLVDRQRQRVGDDDLGDRRVLDPVDRRAREDAVGGG